MIIHDPKKAAALIISSSMPDREDSSGDSDESDETLGIAHDILDAVKSGSAHQLAMALRAFHAACESYEDESEESDESM